MEKVIESNEVRMENDDSLLLRMREGRASCPTAFMKFIQAKSFHSAYAFCFYEGEDGAYYNPRIEQYLNDGDHFIPVIAGNKKNVLKVMEKIRSDSTYDSVRIMFFVDRDFDDPQSPHRDLYETSGYSVENFYVDEDAFCRILRSCFYINKSDSDYVEYLNIYRRSFEQFHKFILPFNVRVKYQHQYAPMNTGCSFGKMNETSHYVNITAGGVVMARRHDEKIRKLDEALDPDINILSEIEQELEKASNPHCTYRGKNELFCLTKLLECMKEKYNSSEDREQERKIKVKLVANHDPLVTLSQFASTPQELIDFIIAHRPLSA